MTLMCLCQRKTPERAAKSRLVPSKRKGSIQRRTGQKDAHSQQWSTRNDDGNL